MAGNAINQDPLSVAAGLKTVSMRINGTSVKEMQEAGEDTTGMIETYSKLESQVKSLTAVNGKLGVSLRDTNGNYRSTYEVLSDIANVWEDIQSADKADGKNRTNALLEILAGKNRANIVASILDNPEMLNNAYEDVQNSMNSAANEQASYMESMEAHLNILTSKFQELWQNTINTEAANSFIDFLGNAIDLVNDLGGLTPVITGLVAAFASFKGVG